MTTVIPAPAGTTPETSTSARAQALAARLEQGARSLANLAASLTDEQWRSVIPHDGRAIGVVVHHVGTMYPLEIELAQQLAAGAPIAGVTWEAVHALNATHATEHATVTKAAAVDLLRRNSAEAADAIRALTDEQLDRASTVSLNADAPLTCQFFLEDHAVRHSFHHLAKIQAVLAAPVPAPGAAR